MQFAKKLLRMRVKRRLSQVALAKKAGISSDTITKIESHKHKNRPFAKTIGPLAEALDVPFEWLNDDSLGFKDLERLQREEEVGRLGMGVDLPVFPIGADHERDWSDGSFPVGVSDQFHPAAPDITDKSAFYCQVFGDSMAPVIVEGDLLLFAPNQYGKWEDGAICLVRTHEWATVKRVYRLKGSKIRLVAENRAYPEQVVDLQADVIQLCPAVKVVKSLIGNDG